jgi:nuclear GTP-binding protein
VFKADNQHSGPDLESAAKHLVRDWAQNTFPYYSTPKASGASDMDVDSAAQPDMSAVLEACSSRKDMRKVGKGVVRFKGGEIDVREIILDDDYTAGLAPSDDEDEDEDDDEEEGDEEDEELETDELDSDEEVIEGADFEVESRRRMRKSPSPNPSLFPENSSVKPTLSPHLAKRRKPEPTNEFLSGESWVLLEARRRRRKSRVS